MAKKQAEKGNKILLAGIGAFATVQSAFESGFESLVAKGAAAQKEYKASFDKFGKEIRTDVTSQIDDVKDRAVRLYDEKSPIKFDAFKKRIDGVTETIGARTSGLFNIATSRDIDALNEKLDRVIEKVAA